MREMKDSGVEWIGEVPDDWEIGKTLFALSMAITDGPHETPELLAEGIPFVSAEAVSCGNGTVDFSHIRGFVSEEFYEECCKKYIPQINDIYMIKSGATTGKVAIVETDDIFTIWSPLAVFRCNPENFDCKYLFYFLQSDAYQKQLENKWSYGTQQNIGMRTLEKLFVCFPSLLTQHRIADYLDAKCAQIDRAIARQQEVIEKLKEYKLSVITEAVTKGLNPDVPMKNSGIEWIGKIPEAWDTKKLKYVARFQTGATPSSNNPELFEGDFLWYTPADFNSLVLNSSSRTISDDAIKNGSVPVYPAKSVLFVGIGATTGKIGFSEKDCSSNQQITAIISGMDMEGKFAAYFLTSVANIIRGNAQFTTLPIVNNKELADIVIVSPPLNEQKAIMKHLDSKCSKIEESITTKKIIIDKLIEYKKSLIYEVVTGKREV